MHIWIAPGTSFNLVYNKFTFADVSNLSDDVIKKKLRCFLQLYPAFLVYGLLIVTFYALFNICH